MTDDYEITRRRIHDLADSTHAVAVELAVVRERLTAQSTQMDRIEGALDICTNLLRVQNGRVNAVEKIVAVLEDRADTNRDAAATAKTDAMKWSAALGAFVAALISGVAAFFGGGK